jgi:L-ribulose-5-phosphate 3-epimerase
MRFSDRPYKKIHECMNDAGNLGFDGFDVLEKQLAESFWKNKQYLSDLKRLAHERALPMVAMSTHQGFVSPDKEKRKRNIARTILSLDRAYEL